MIYYRVCESFREVLVILFEIQALELQRGMMREGSGSEQGIGSGKI